MYAYKPSPLRFNTIYSGILSFVISAVFRKFKRDFKVPKLIVKNVRKEF